MIHLFISYPTMSAINRAAIQMATKQEALRLIGIQQDGTSSTWLRRKANGKLYNATDVENLLNIHRTGIYPWLKNGKPSLCVGKSSEETKDSTGWTVRHPRIGCVHISYEDSRDAQWSIPIRGERNKEKGYKDQRLTTRRTKDESWGDLLRKNLEWTLEITEL